MLTAFLNRAQRHQTPVRFFFFLFSACCLLAQSEVRTYLPKAGLLARYRLNDCSGTTCPDTSGNGNNATMVNSPTSGTVGLSMTGASANGGGYLQLPAGASGAKSVMICADFSQNTLPNGFYAAYWGSSTASTMAVLLNSSYDLMFWNGSTPTQPAMTTPPRGCLTVVAASSGGDQFYWQGIPVAYYIAQGNSASSMAVNQLFGSTNCASCYSFNGTGYYAALWSTQLTAAQVEQATNAAWTEIQARGSYTNYVNTSTNSPLICVGDSIIWGAVSGQSFCNSTLLSLTDTYTPYTIAISGTTAQQWATMADGFLQTVYAPQARHNTILAMMGTNDIATNGNTASQAFDKVRADVLHWRGMGWQVVYVDMIDRNTISTQVQQFDALVRATWKSWADGLADIAADVRFGSSGANANTTYFNGGVHPTLVGQNLFIPTINQAINAVNGHTDIGCNTWTIPYTNEGLNVAATTATIQVALPQQYTKLIGTTILPTVAFAGTGITSMTLSLGDSTSATVYGPAYNIFQATGGTVFQDTPLFKSTTMTASPPVLNATFTANTNLGKASQTITAATAASPSVLTATSHGLSNGNVAYISGFTGNWTPMNGHCIVGNVTTNTFTCTMDGGNVINASAFGAMAGSPVFTSTFLTAGSVGITSCALQIQ